MINRTAKKCFVSFINLNFINTILLLMCSYVLNRLEQISKLFGTVMNKLRER